MSPAGTRSEPFSAGLSIGSNRGPSGESTIVNPRPAIRSRSSSAAAKSFARLRSSRSAASRRMSSGTSEDGI